MTPNEIEVLIHYFCCARPHPRIEAPAVQDAICRFLEAKLLRLTEDGNCHEVTDGGDVLMRALCNVPFPVQKWVMP